MKRTVYVCNARYVSKWDISGEGAVRIWEETHSEGNVVSCVLNKQEDRLLLSGLVNKLQLRNAADGSVIRDKAFPKPGALRLNVDNYDTVYFGGDSKIMTIRISDLEVLKTFTPDSLPADGITVFAVSKCCSSPQRQNMCNPCKRDPGFLFETAGLFSYIFWKAVI